MPEHVLFDNTKAVVIKRDAYGEGLHRWNSELRDLAEACGFTPRLCRPYRAKTKGKVERFNSYLKGSFLVPLVATLEASGLRLDANLANLHVRRWLDDVAKGRIEASMSAQAAALMEAYEESGLQVKLLRHLVDVRRSQTYTRYYLAERLGGTPADMGWESQAVMLVPPALLPRLVSHPNDAGILAALGD